MPVYDYKCEQHGRFYGLATMDDSDKPAHCPECGKVSARIIVISPDILAMDKDKKQAHELNEKNQHEPTLSSKARRAEDEEHKAGCGCEKKLGKAKMMYTARGEKIFPSMRPWMISH
ncbi:FmdB family zinc ribbon protein [Agaribacterium sp. ZY112]|uniref:FmdB family zinc ribbon protein n=1 Tax=Agaribacterium sp. ZY112 TaxID=3233574 RepID=UPI00352527B8